jgi:hypothetical protein
MLVVRHCTVKVKQYNHSPELILSSSFFTLHFMKFRTPAINYVKNFGIKMFN